MTSLYDRILDKIADWPEVAVLVLLCVLSMVIGMLIITLVRWILT